MSHPAARPIADALGLVRSLFKAELDESRRSQLAQVGRSLTRAAAMSGAPQGSMGFRAVRGHAENALTSLEAMPWSADVGAVVAAARGRIAVGLAAALDAERVQPADREGRRRGRVKRNA